MKSIVIFILLAILISCKNEIISDDEIITSYAIESASIPIDTSKKVPLPIHKLTNYERKVFEYLSQTRKSFDLKDSTNILSDPEFISNHKFNDKILVVVKEKFNFNKAELFFVDKKSLNIDTSIIINGCHYNSPKITVKDWDNDGSKEIIATLTFPVQSVPHIVYELFVYKIDKKSNRYKEIFFLETDERDGRGDNNIVNSYDKFKSIGGQIIRKYKIISKSKIEIKVQKFKYNSDSFEWELPIKSKKPISTRTYIMRWDEAKYQFQ